MNEPPDAANHIGASILDGFSAAIVAGVGIWIFIRVFKRSEAPNLLLLKWLVSLALGAVMYWKVFPGFEQGGMAADNGLVYMLFCALGFVVLWRRNLAEIVGNTFSRLYDGGTTPPESKPLYSTAIAQRKRGRYNEAIAAIRKEMEKFPDDLDGQLMLADIQAENLNDLPGAAITVQRICHQRGRTPGNIAFALNTLADWYLKYDQDRDAARETLQRIIELLPDSEMAMLAAQRIGSLASTEHLVGQHDRKIFAVVEGVQNLGLLDPKFHPKPADPDVAKEAGELVEHLQAHPLDAEARERLAVIYAEHYQRLDLATDQLEQLVAHPNQPQKRVVHWLNVLADLQIHHGENYDTVRATLQRICDLFPNTSVAELAANRIGILKLHLKAKEKSQDVKLGSYEQDIGLKM